MPPQRQSRLAVLPLPAAVIVASLLAAADAAIAPSVAQVIMGLPDKAPPTAAKQPASDAVKTGMSAVRKLVLDAHTLITHRRFAPDQARRFSTSIKQSVAALKSDPAAPALADVLTLLDDGATQIAAPMSGDSQLDALAKFETALDRYPQLFDDPEWKPLR
jgi:hypothetical protein